MQTKVLNNAVSQESHRTGSLMPLMGLYLIPEKNTAETQLNPAKPSRRRTPALLVLVGGDLRSIWGSIWGQSGVNPARVRFEAGSGPARVERIGKAEGMPVRMTGA
jgi:hypothetical protein